MLNWLHGVFAAKDMNLKDTKLNRIDLIFLALGAIIFLLFVLDLLGTRILFYGDANAASFLLSSFPQSLAALFGITFSILIIAIEFSASKYTPKVLHFLLPQFSKIFRLWASSCFSLRQCLSVS